MLELFKMKSLMQRKKATKSQGITGHKRIRKQMHCPEQKKCIKEDCR